MTIKTAMEKIFVLLTALQLTLLGCTVGNSIYQQPAIASTNAILSCGAAYLEGSDKGQEFRPGLEFLAWSFRSLDGNYTFLGGRNSTGFVLIAIDPQKYAIDGKTGFLTIYNVTKADKTGYKCTVRDQTMLDTEPHESFVKLEVIEIPVTTSLTTESRNTSKYLPVDGKWFAWGAWSAWSPCTKTCGHGTSTRERVCNNPIPAYGGAACRSNTYEAQVCLVGHCSTSPPSIPKKSPPVDGKWSAWGAWSPCTKICGHGVSTRVHVCNNPVPAHGGAACIGDTYEAEVCLVGHCSSKPSKPDESSTVWSWALTGKILVAPFIVSIVVNVILACTYLKRCGLFPSQNEIISSDVDHQNPMFEVPIFDGEEKCNAEENLPGTDAGGENHLIGIQENSTENDLLRYHTLGL